MRVVVDPSEAAELARPALGVTGDFDVNPRSGRVRDTLPGVHASYVKILHAIYRDPTYEDSGRSWEDVEGDARREWWASRDVEAPGVLVRQSLEPVTPEWEWERVLWSDLLAAPPGPATDWPDLSAAFGGGSWPREIVGPDEGTLDEASLRELVKVLAFTGMQRECIMFMEWWHAYTAASAAISEKVGLVAVGDIEEVAEFADQFVWTPDVWWADGGDWAVATDHDSCATIVGGPEKLIGVLIELPELETVALEAGDVVWPYVQSRWEASNRGDSL